MKSLLLFLGIMLIPSLGISQDIIGEWIRTTSSCQEGQKMTQTFKADGTGFVTVPDCNKTCAPYEYTMTFKWKIAKNTLTLEYLTVSEYCGVKQKAPGTFDMEFEASKNNLRIVQDLYVRQ